MRITYFSVGQWKLLFPIIYDWTKQWIFSFFFCCSKQHCMRFAICVLWALCFLAIANDRVNNAAHSARHITNILIRVVFWWFRISNKNACCVNLSIWVFQIDSHWCLWSEKKKEFQMRISKTDNITHTRSRSHFHFRLFVSRRQKFQLFCRNAIQYSAFRYSSSVFTILFYLSCFFWISIFFCSCIFNRNCVSRSISNSNSNSNWIKTVEI